MKSLKFYTSIYMLPNDGTVYLDTTQQIGDTAYIARNTINEAEYDQLTPSQVGQVIAAHVTEFIKFGEKQ